VNEVTTPKCPPPDPRQAQSSSAFSRASHAITSPAAVATRIPITLSQVRPSFRPSTPWPPPSARPAIPTDAQVPPGIASPKGAVPAYTSMSRAPAPTVAVPAPRSTSTCASEPTSHTSPSVVEYPA
jgi:hypothetical protein